ncbi:MAG: pyridoxamine 5'-phosphate oxidase family protein [Actinomycetota bacterium]|nr:pyridoxamine 5'-phosphate oxidase family protein [Actinomycetota bacterium]
MGLAFLGTVRADGGPRAHPMCPIILEEGLFAFLVPSPKRDDLRRDPRYAMHSFPAETNEDAFYVTGEAWPVADERLRGELEATFLRERQWESAPPGLEVQQVFEFGVDRCLHTTTTGHGDPHPSHVVWRAP